MDNETTLSESASRVAWAGEIPALGKTASRNGDAASSPTVAHFVCTLFRLLEQSSIRYCVLHGWDELPIIYPVIWIWRYIRRTSRDSHDTGINAPERLHPLSVEELRHEGA